MNRFSVLYLHQDAYGQLSCSSRAEADYHLSHVSCAIGNTPLGIYDAKTELFAWEYTLQQQYNRMSLEEQGRLGHQMIAIVELLRSGPTPNYN